MLSKTRYSEFIRRFNQVKLANSYPYFRAVSKVCGAEIEVDNRRLIQAGSNDYLGLASDPRVIEAAAAAIRHMGTGPGGSRLLSGNMLLHEELEAQMADFLGKRAAIVYTTGFLANLGTLGTLPERGDLLLCDRESHASIFAAAFKSAARFLTFKHNDCASAQNRLHQARKKLPQATVFLVTEGVFSMSGDTADLTGILDLKQRDGNVMVYLDDAHGIGVLGENGRGTANSLGLTRDVDIIMGTFSKSLASIGGFIASDDKYMIEFLKHNARSFLFTAGLPAGSAAAALKCLEILQREPERIARLRQVTNIMRDGYQQLGIPVKDSPGPIIPIPIGDELAAYKFASELFELGVFALPATYPAVPRGKSIIRTTFSAGHSQEHLDFVLETLAGMLPKYGLVEQHGKSVLAAGCVNQ